MLRSEELEEQIGLHHLVQENRTCSTCICSHNGKETQLSNSTSEESS